MGRIGGAGRAIGRTCNRRNMMTYFDHRALITLLVVLSLGMASSSAARLLVQDAKPAKKQDAKTKHEEREKPAKDINDS